MLVIGSGNVDFRRLRVQRCRMIQKGNNSLLPQYMSCKMESRAHENNTRVRGIQVDIISQNPKVKMVLAFAEFRLILLFGIISREQPERTRVPLDNHATLIPTRKSRESVRVCTTRGSPRFLRSAHMVTCRELV